MRKYIAAGFAVMIAVAVSGCSVVTTADISSSVEMPSSFAADMQGERSDIRKWWEEWHDPQLSGLIEKAFARNYDLKAARSRIAEADACAAYADADLGPKAEFGLKGMAGKMSMTSPMPLMGDRISGNPRALTGSLAASWEIDLFGKKQSDADMQTYRALGARDYEQAVRVEIAAKVADTYFKAVAAGQELDLLKESIASLGEMRRYVKGRFDAGQATSYDLDHITNEITKKESSLKLVEAKRANLIRALAVLAGDVPQNFTDTLGRKLIRRSDEPKPPTGVYPGDILKQRPDLLAKSNEIKALAAGVASATADLYPRLSISFLWSSGVIHISNDFNSIRTWSGLADIDLSVPVFTNGRIRAGIDLADARLKTALAEYDQKLLQSLAEVDSSYALAKGYADRQRVLVKALGEAEKLCATTRKMFELDESDYDRVIDAKLNEIGIRNELLAADLKYHESIIGLYRSLGGGWEGKPAGDSGEENSTAVDAEK